MSSKHRNDDDDDEEEEPLAPPSRTTLTLPHSTDPTHTESTSSDRRPRSDPDTFTHTSDDELELAVAKAYDGDTPDGTGAAYDTGNAADPTPPRVVTTTGRARPTPSGAATRSSVDDTHSTRRHARPPIVTDTTSAARRPSSVPASTTVAFPTVGSPVDGLELDTLGLPTTSSGCRLPDAELVCPLTTSRGTAEKLESVGAVARLRFEHVSVAISPSEARLALTDTSPHEAAHPAPSSPTPDTSPTSAPALLTFTRSSTPASPAYSTVDDPVPPEPAPTGVTRASTASTLGGSYEKAPSRGAASPFCFVLSSTDRPTPVPAGNEHVSSVPELTTTEPHGLPPIRT